MRPKHRRLVLLGLALLALAGAAALVLTVLEDNIVFFRSPTDVAEKKVQTGRVIRLGGLVEKDSVRKLADGLTVTFKITDLANSVPVTYTGILPDLFREGQGVVAAGELRPDGVFAAREVLAKHDENYMPPEVVEALKKSGQWKEGQQ